ncbi:MAG: peptide chain release factor N(5)-glutamine methyltransferase [Spirochaetaceae bacterium]|nr:peptide chain release factor N(5)-glutamine methyltransferase [Spirochaetaceae bacterium]
MTIREALREGWSALTGSDTETPQLDTSLLLSHACGVSREKLYMDLPEELDEKRLELFRANMKRRISGEPVAWIIGNKEFWGLDFKVGPGVLCRRPDSEILIESALEIMGKKKSGSLHDCCTGPGTLALTLASERPSWDISASDISVQAADFFKANNQKLTGSRVRYTHSDLMNGINETFDVIVSNPPYLTPVEMGDKVALGWKEPELALDGGGIDGLNLIRRLIPRISDHLNSRAAVLIEADPLQMPIIKQILSDAGFVRITFRQDLAGRNRIVIAFKE